MDLNKDPGKPLKTEILNIQKAATKSDTKSLENMEMTKSNKKSTKTKLHQNKINFNHITKTKKYNS